MREGYGSHSVCVSVRLSVTTLAATYLVCESKLQCYKVPYGVPNSWFVCISQKMLYSPVLASFADSKLLDFSDPDQPTLCINRMLCVSRYIRHRPNNYTHARGLHGRGLRTRLMIAMLALLYWMLLASMVCPAKCVSLSSSQFSEALHFLWLILFQCLLKNQIIPPVKHCPKRSFKLSLCTTMKLYIIRLYENYDHLYNYLPSMSLL